MNTTRLIWLSVAALSLLVLAFSSYALAQRVDSWNNENATPIWYWQEMEETRFEFQGREVDVTWDVNDAGEGTVFVAYGDETLELPVAIPNRNAFPGFMRFQDWLRVLVFADSERRSVPDFEAALDSGDITLRAVVVTRVPDPEVLDKGPLANVLNIDVDDDSWGWGETMRHQWSFDFYELLPGGGFEKTTKRWPESWQSLYRRQVRASQRGEPLPERNEGEFVYGEWQHDAALRVSPRAPGITMERQALRNAGWTLPTASGSLLLALVSVAFAFAPSRRWGPDERESSTDDEAAS